MRPVTSPLSSVFRPVALATLVVSLLLSFSAFASPASAQDHEGAIVPGNPRNDTPEVLDGIVWDTEQWNNMIVVVGEFDLVEDTDGTVYSQPNLMAYDINTGAMITSFNPQINGSLREVEVAEDGQSIFAAGAFNTVDGLTRKRIVKLDAAGEVVTAFNANISAEVNGLAVANGKVYVGGSFLKVENQLRSKIGAVDAVTGDIDPLFDLPITGGIGKNGNFSVKAIDITPDGNTLMAAHTGTFVDGVERAGVVLIDISGPAASVLPWQTDLYHDWYHRCAGGYLSLRDAEISPDGSYFVVVGKGHDRPPVCDTAIRWPIAGGAGLQPDWISRHFDSVYSVGISDSVVYTGGHFRVQEAPGSPDPYPGDQLRTYNIGNANDVADLGDDIVISDQVGALDPATGKSLPWTPATNSAGCVCSLTTIDRGLLLGHDRTQVGVFTTGRHAFFDFGTTADTTLPNVTITSPSTGQTLGQPISLTGVATDNIGVTQVFMTVRSRNGLGWLRTDGTFGAWQRHPISADSPGATSTTFTAMPTLPDGDFRAYFWAEDPAGNRSTPNQNVQFFVSSAVDTQAPSANFATPTLNQAIIGPVSFSGVATDDQSVESVEIAVRNRTTGDWLQPDFTWAPGWDSLDVPLNATGTSVAYNYSLLLPAGSYKANVIATDSAGKKTPFPRPSVNFTVN